MRIRFLLLLPSLFLWPFLFSCQTSKQAEDAEDNQAEKLAQQIQNQKQDSLQIAFCECLVKDSINREERLATIDNFISQKIDINTPCSFEEEVISSSAETALINMGVAVSNRFLRTKFRKRYSKVNTITKNYPTLMLFSGDTLMIRQLVNRGANLDTKTKDIVSLPEYYVSQNDLENIKFVLSLGAKVDEINIGTDNEKMIDFLIEKGAKRDNINKIALFRKENYKKLAEKYKIDLSKTTCKEFNIISKVTQFQKINFERTEWFLENKVDASCIDGSFLEDIIDENFDGQIYSTHSKKKANQHTRNDWIELVGKYNANWNQCASFGKNPLMLAVEKHNFELIKTLLDQKADPNFACDFAGQQKTAQDVLEQEISYATNNEIRKKERDKDKYSKKDTEKHAAYMKTLNEIKFLLEKY
jgi:hypothetical protein